MRYLIRVGRHFLIWGTVLHFARNVLRFSDPCPPIKTSRTFFEPKILLDQTAMKSAELPPEGARARCASSRAARAAAGTTRDRHANTPMRAITMRRRARRPRPCVSGAREPRQNGIVSEFALNSPQNGTQLPHRSLPLCCRHCVSRPPATHEALNNT